MVPSSVLFPRVEVLGAELHPYTPWGLPSCPCPLLLSLTLKPGTLSSAERS